MPAPGWLFWRCPFPGSFFIVCTLNWPAEHGLSKGYLIISISYANCQSFLKGGTWVSSTNVLSLLMDSWCQVNKGQAFHSLQLQRDTLKENSQGIIFQPIEAGVGLPWDWGVWGGGGRIFFFAFLLLSWKISYTLMDIAEAGLARSGRGEGNSGQSQHGTCKKIASWKSCCMLNSLNMKPIFP